MTTLQLTKEEEDKVLEQFRYNRRQLESDLVVLKSWLADQTHLPTSRLEEGDFFLTKFLVGCKGSLLGAQKKIDAYYTLRASLKILASRDPADEVMMKTYQLTPVSSLPQLVFGSRVSFFRLISDDTEQFDISGVIRNAIYEVEVRIRENGITPDEYCVLDAKNSHSGHLTKINPQVIREGTVFFQEACPLRLKKVICINCSQVFSIVFNKFFKPFLKKKISDRFIICPDESILLEHFPKEILPSEYGGEAGSLEAMSKIRSKELIEKRDWFITDLSELTDESKRPRSETSNNSDLGIQGSIKSLCID